MDAGDARRTTIADRLSVRVHVPSPDLQGYVTFFYFVDADGPLTDFLYPEWGNVRFAVRGEWAVRMPGHYPEGWQRAVLFGPTDRCGRIATTGGTVAGFGLTPIGWHCLIDDDPSRMANRVTDLDDMLELPGLAVRDRLRVDASDVARVARLEGLLRARLARRRPPDPLVLRADRALRRRPADVDTFAAAVGLPARSLQRLCLRGFGFAPKRLLRRQRFLDTLGQIRTAVGGKIGASLDAAYYDQAHFYRDFRDFMGMTPRAYFAAPRELMMAAAAAQVRAGVTLSFALPPPPD